MREGAKTIKMEVRTLGTVLRLAQDRGLWKGIIDHVIPKTFDPPAADKKRDFTRAELLRLLPHLTPGCAAIVCFVLATSAEDAALQRLSVSDLSIQVQGIRHVRVPGSKTEQRDRLVPIVTSEQKLLIDYAVALANGSDDRVFGSLGSFRRDLGLACEKASLPHVWPHALRKAAGQWLIDLGVPIELVSKVLGHADTRITEHTYAKVKREDVGSRILSMLSADLVSPELVGKTIVKVEPIKSLPLPRHVFEVDGVIKTLDTWSKVSGIPKTTLHHRVMTKGMSMKDALARSDGRRGSPLPVSSVRNQCRTNAAVEGSVSQSTPPICREFAADSAALMGRNDTEIAPAASHKRPKSPGKPVPRDGIEPPTRGFSILCSTN
jgi:hypothetical protein